MKVSEKNLQDLIQGDKQVEAVIVDPNECNPINTHHRVKLQARKNLRATLELKDYQRYGMSFQAVFRQPRTVRCSFKSTTGLDIVFIDNMPVEHFVAHSPDWVIKNDELVSSNQIVSPTGETVDPTSVFSSFNKRSLGTSKISVIEVMDHSTSMRGLETAFVNAVNAERQALRNISSEYPSQTYTSTLIEFSDSHSVVVKYKDQPLDFLIDLDSSFRFSGGSTALLDAIMLSIVQSKLITDADKHLIIITTDGEENSSRLYNKSRNGFGKVKAEIEKLTDTGNYTFVLCGPEETWYANAKETALKLGIDISNVRAFSNTDESVESMSSARQSAYASYAAKTSKGESTKFGFFDEN